MTCHKHGHISLHAVRNRVPGGAHGLKPAKGALSDSYSLVDAESPATGATAGSTPTLSRQRKMPML